MSHRNLAMIYQILEHIFLIITDASHAYWEGDALICRRQLNEQTGYGAHASHAGSLTFRRESHYVME
jgi:hypothetical protein